MNDNVHISNWLAIISYYIYIYTLPIFRQYEKLTEIAEEKKADFAKFEQEDIKCREDLKHTKERQKKLVKSLEKERAKVRPMLYVLDCTQTSSS